MSRTGYTLVELMVALTVLSVGLGAAAALTGSAASGLTRARALDESVGVLVTFVDSIVAVAGQGSGSRTLSQGVLTWSVPASTGAPAWARFEHEALGAPLELHFAHPVP